MKLFTILLNIAKRIKTAFSRLTTLETWQTETADYVVEQGTKNGWKYVKWSSGNGTAFATDTQTVGNTTGWSVVWASTINGIFGVSNSSSSNTIVTFANGNGASSSAHIEGTTFQNGIWYAVADRNVNATVTLVIKVDYFAS